MNYGFEEKPHPLQVVAGTVFGALVGAVAGLVAFFFVTSLSRLLFDALPGMTPIWRFAIYAAAVAVPAFACAGVFRNPRATLGSRVMASVTIIVLVGLFAGEIAGVVRLYPRQFHFFIAPGPPK